MLRNLAACIQVFAFALLLFPGVDASGAVPTLSEQVKLQTVLIEKVKKSNPKDNRLFFLKTQKGILQKLAEKYVDPKDANAIWLKNVVHSFMTPMHLAFEGKITNKTEVDPWWAEISSGKLAGGWWKVALAESKSAPLELAGPFPKASQEEIAAFPLMLAHIWYDLRVALIVHGPGTDAMWNEVAQIVTDEMSDKKGMPRSFMEGMLVVAGVMPSLKPFNPILMRNTMRGQVIAFLKSKGITSPTSGYQGPTSPPKEAFPVFGK